MEHTFIVNEDHIRIDTYVSRQLVGKSRSFVANLILEGKIQCNGLPCKPSHKIMTGDVIAAQIPPSRELNARPQPIPLHIIYDDEWLSVINKPQGMVVHPAPGHQDQTLVNALLYRFEGKLSDMNGVIRPGIVHRIDKDTSGLILIVKKNEVHEKIAEAIRMHQIKRTYQALVNGILLSDHGTMDLPIGRNPQNRMKNTVIKTGKPAITHFRVIKRFLQSNITHVEATLETGRTHQIRVHFAHLGHPVLGDPLYGGIRRDIKTKGQTLHASHLEFYHPILKNVIILESPLPEHFRDIMEKLK